MTLPIAEREHCRHGARLDSECSECVGEGSTTDEKRRWRPSDELDGLPLGTAEEERQRAKAWMDTAAQNQRNADYWRRQYEGTH